MTPHTIARQWKGKPCLIELDPSGNAASLWREPAEGYPPFTVFDPFAEKVPSINGDASIYTDPRFFQPQTAHHMRYMAEGVMSGLETRPTHLPGRFIICKAIGLAVHLGASRICLKGTEHITARALRNLGSMVRPLKGHRVHVFEPAGVTGLFPVE